MQRQLKQEQTKGCAQLGATESNPAQGGLENYTIMMDNAANPENNNDLVITQNDEKLYLIDPEKRSENAPLSDDILDAIQKKAQKRSKRLAKQERKQIKQELNGILFSQLNKLEAKFSQLQELWQVFDMEIQDATAVRDECLVERVALSVAKRSSNTETKFNQI